MSETDADRFRQEAEECRRFAESSASPLDKEAWLRLAANLIKMAENAEQRRAPGWLRGSPAMTLGSLLVRLSAAVVILI